MSGYVNQHDVIEQFKDFSQSEGIELPADLIADGQIHRFKLSDEKQGKLSGWYVLHTDNVPAGKVGSFKTCSDGIAWKYNDPDYKPAQLTPEQRKQQAETIRQSKERTAKERAEAQAAAAEKANFLWNKSKPLTDNESHPYLVRKGIKGAYPLRVNSYNGVTSLVIPLDKDDKLTAIEFIKPEKPADGTTDKKIVGDKKGGYFRLNKMDHPRYVAIGEGFATVASVIEDESIKYREGFMGVMAVDAGNLEAVAVAMREKYPTAEIFLFGDIGDTDHKGEKSARAAAKLVNGYCVLPPMAKGDFNDYLTGGAVSVSLDDLIMAAVNEAYEASQTSNTELLNVAGHTNNDDSNLNDCPDFPPLDYSTMPPDDYDHAPIGNDALNYEGDTVASSQPDTMPTTHNAILDNEQHHCTVDFLKYVDKTHIMKQLALSIASATHLPAHTVFIMGLGVFSSVACRRWRVEYQHGGSLPIGLYAVAEQPSGAAKSRCLNTFQSPFYAAEKEAKNTAKARLNQLKDTDKKDLTDSEQLEIEQLQSIIKSTLFTTNSTPEALEQSLTHSRGYFSAVSSEQGLFNTMLGGCYGNDKASNNDLLLNGFDSGYMSSKRIGRDTYTGAIVGGAVMFAQMGGIETLLKASNGTGLAERFLLIAEPHNLGNRDHTKAAIISHSLVEQYNAICESFAKYAVSDPIEVDDLTRLDICHDGWRLIAEYRNSIEHHLADGGRYSHVSIRGAAAKIDMQIMKIAANLHLLDDYQNKTATIDLKHVQASIGIANAMIESILKLCTDKGIVGVKAEYTAILSLFEFNSKPRTGREIIQAKAKATPFKEFTGNKSELIKSTLTDMVKGGVLKETFTPDNVKLYSLAQ